MRVIRRCHAVERDFPAVSRNTCDTKRVVTVDDSRGAFLDDQQKRLAEEKPVYLARNPSESESRDPPEHDFSFVAILSTGARSITINGVRCRRR